MIIAKRRITSLWGMLIIMLAIVLAFPHSSQSSMQRPPTPIVDNGAMLSSAQVAAISDAVANAPFTLYVYTVDSLGAQAIDELATETFASWSLDRDDALLIIASAEREVYLELAIGSDLERSIMQAPELSGSNPHTQFLDRAFIPFAAEGDFGQAVVSVIDELARLHEAYNTRVDQAPAPAAPTSPQRQDQGSTTSISPLALALGLVVIVALVLVIRQLLARRKLKRNWQEATVKYQAALGSVNMLQRELEPLVQLSRGQSEVHLQGLQKEFDQLLQQSAQYMKTMRAFTIPVWITKTLMSQPQRTEKEIAVFQTKADELLQAVASYKEQDAAIARTLKSCQQQWSNMSASLEGLQADYGYPFKQLTERTSKLGQQIEQYMKTSTFDPLSVKDQAESLPSQLDELASDISLIREQSEAYAAFPDRLHKTRQRLDELVRREQLLLSEIKPYSLFDYADTELEHLKAALQEGNTGLASSIAAKLMQDMEEAVQLVIESIEARDWNEKAITRIRREAGEFDPNHITMLNSKLQNIKQQYDSTHWTAIPAEIKRIESTRSQILEQLPGVAGLNESTVQRYMECRRLLEQQLQQLADCRQLSESIQQKRQELDHAYEDSLALVERLKQRSASYQAQIRQHALPERNYPHLLALVSERIGEIEHAQSHTLRNLKLIQEAIEQVNPLLSELEQQVNRDIKEKQAAERQIADFERSYQRSLTNCRRFINYTHFNRGHSQLRSAMEQSIRLGEYAAIATMVQEGHTLIKHMESEYRIKYAEYQERERRRRIAAAQRRNHWGGGGGGSRGGGSGWGGGGSRGGGSGWGGGGSRGGGSKW